MNSEASQFRHIYILSIAMVSALGGLLFGYDWVVIGGAKPFYEPWFGIADSPALQGWAVSCALIGCMAGAALSGMLADRFGRKRLLLLSALLFLVSAAGTGASDAFVVFVIYRILGGIGIGMASNVSPMYIAEISPPASRGRLVSLNQLTIVIGILLAQITNWLIAEPMADNISAQDILQSWNGQHGWRWMFWAELVPAALFFILTWWIPESPRWLVRNQNLSKAGKVLDSIGGAQYANSALAAIEQSLKETTAAGFNLRMLVRSGLWGVLLIGIILAAFQQWCGINVIFMYADEVFSAAGYSVSDMLFNIVITGSVNLIFTLVAMSVVDRWGRKSLMLLGAGGLALIYAILGTCYYMGVQGLPMLILVVAAIACYAMTLAPVTWVVLSEIFPNRVRGAAMAVATFALWVASALLTFFFPIINELILASGSFWLFSIICVLGFWFIKARLVETKGQSLEEIERIYDPAHHNT